jgi:hypothetical protein
MELESNLAGKLVSLQRETEDKLQSVDSKLTENTVKIRREIEEKEAALSESISTRYVCMYSMYISIQFMFVCDIKYIYVCVSKT